MQHCTSLVSSGSKKCREFLDKLSQLLPSQGACIMQVLVNARLCVINCELGSRV
jgi:hypothetical protein